MNTEISKIINTINNVSKFTKYREFHLKKSVSITNNDLKNLINQLNKNSKTVCLYNKKTLKADIIGVIDLNGKRYIDFDDNIYSMINKGINNQISDYIC
jgi:hypothetical protein